jgi:hypothetical protein
MKIIIIVLIGAVVGLALLAYLWERGNKNK